MLILWKLNRAKLADRVQLIKIQAYCKGREDARNHKPTRLLDTITGELKADMHR